MDNLKAKLQAIGEIKKIPLTFGDTIVNYIEIYKYLGHTQNTKKTNLNDHLTVTKQKVETIIAIAGNRNFKGIELEAIWEMTVAVYLVS